ncbi:unnamed protein product, partial [Owenia fusiformis]
RKTGSAVISKEKVNKPFAVDFGKLTHYSVKICNLFIDRHSCLMASIDYFKNQTAWFSSSVPATRKDLWVNHGGTLANENDALFLFSDKADSDDTKRLYNSDAYLIDQLAVFHASYVNECVRKRGMNNVILGRYFLPPSEVHEIIRQQTRFPWDVEDTTSIVQESTSNVRTPSSTRKQKQTTSSQRQSSPKHKTPLNKQHSQRKQNQTKQRKQHENEGHRNTAPTFDIPQEFSPSVRLKRLAPDSVESARLSSLLVSHDQPNVNSGSTPSTVKRRSQSQETPRSTSHQQPRARSQDDRPPSNSKSQKRTQVHERASSDGVKRKNARSASSRKEHPIWGLFNPADVRDIEDLPYVRLEDIIDFTPGQNGCEVMIATS